MKKKKKPCSVCHCWFISDPRVGNRQKNCGKEACRVEQRRRTQAAWRKRNPAYHIVHRWDQRAKKAQNEANGTSAIRPPPAQFNTIPWELLKDAFGAQQVVMLAFLMRVVLRAAQDAMRPQLIDIMSEIDRLRSTTAQDVIDSACG